MNNEWYDDMIINDIIWMNMNKWWMNEWINKWWINEMNEWNDE